MRRAISGLLAGLMLWLVVPSGAHSLLAARHKPGPVTLRGVVKDLRGATFSLVTHTRGTYRVTVSRNTTIVEKGVTGHLLLHDDDHVGVRGFVQSRNLQAMQVRIYPVKPKPYSIDGTVSSIHGPALVVATTRGTVTIRVDSSTLVYLGNTVGTLSDVRAGDRVRLHVQSVGGSIKALTIHISRPRISRTHLKLQGKVTSIVRDLLGIRTSSATYTVRLVASTTFYLGSARQTRASLHTGLEVLIYACCVGGPLSALSVHISRTSVKLPSTILKGTIAGINGTKVLLRTSRGTVTVTLQSSTIVESGSARADRRILKVGQTVSVRVIEVNGGYLASRIHIYLVPSRPRTVMGVVTSVGSGQLLVLSRGVKVVVVLSPSVVMTVNGISSNHPSIHVGDHVRAVGTLSSGRLYATRLEVKQTVPRTRTVSLHGTLLTFNSGTLVIVDAAGVRHSVTLTSRVPILLHGRPAPESAFFPGVLVDARGHPTGSTLLATAVSLSVKSRTIRGRVAAVRGLRLTIRPRAAQSVLLDFVKGQTVSDGRKQVAPGQVHIGAYLEVRGFVEPKDIIRPDSVNLMHPTLSLSATVVGTDNGLTVRTSDGEAYLLSIPPSVTIAIGRDRIPVTMGQIPSGAHMHVQGIVRSDGVLAVTDLSLRLPSTTARGVVRQIDSHSLSLQVGSDRMAVDLVSETTVHQGTQALLLKDLVVGDDVSVYGYSARDHTVLARRLVVHRPRTTMDGTVSALAPDGFVLNAADGAHHVVVSAATVFGGSDSSVSVGANVHVTGYLRGDGVILAVRIRIGKRG